MQENIHPNYAAIKVNCSCGNSFNIGSTLGQDLHIEVCNKCHPYYTGEQGKIVDTQGRVDSFANRFGNFGALARKKKEG